MKKVKLFIAAVAMAGVIACGGPDHEAERSVTDLRMYVDSIEKDHANYYTDETYWANVERGYEEKKQQVDAKSARMNEKMKKDYEDLQKDYAELKARYLEERNKAIESPMNWKLVLRKSLFGEGVIGEDMNFNFMTAKNAVSVYENFEKTVSQNRDNYSREDWDEIKLLYEAMDTRKNEIEKDLSMKENNQIAAAKIKFSTIKAINRPLSKMKENSDAKE
jgi:exonuclease VII large subunit